MEISAYTLSSAKLLPKTPQFSYLCFNYSKSHAQKYCVPIWSDKNFAKTAQFTDIITKQQRSFGAICAFGAKNEATNDTETWLLEPIGDGDSRHLGFQVSMPGAFEIASNAVTVGRLPERADLVIPVATVSGVHARIEKKGRNLLVTDLDSTNGTFIGERRLKPGVSVRISSGSSITFGDTHLAKFRVSKLDNDKSSTKSNEPEAVPENEASEKSGAKSESLE